ncbi:ankyrin [Lentithecium fluviatile CBS 122367]|uniref:Ankyrin n=1 Tax=Lentithecium fluviatile CBS 122367 TaxID=1168545 RepID=A0A6G1ICI7_9PLEO|nr:ankyrin [Lentithecium fluviatile CBS 122367]
MDPFSLTAGVIAVLQLANKVISLCLNLQSSLSARKELDLIMDEVDALRDILQRLARLGGKVQADGSDPAYIETVNTRRGPLAICCSELESLQNELNKVKSPGFKFGAKAIAWVMKEKELKGRLKRLSRAKQTLQMSLSLDQTALLLQAQTHSEELRASIEGTNSENNLRTVVDWLGPPYPTSTCNDAQRIRSGNTGNWFLNGESFDQWKFRPRSIVWLSGIPGSGKTIMCSSIVEHMGAWCRSKDGHLLIYFFFDFATRDKGAVSRFLRSLLCQIVVQRRCIPEAVQTLFEQHHNGFQQPSVNALIEALNGTLEDVDQTYLVIDALDECSERSDLLDIVEKVAGWRLNLNVLATSRCESEIEETFMRTDCEHLRLEGAQVNEDIRQYVHQRMARERWLKKWPEDIQAEITSVITNKAGDMFRLAALQLDGLKKCGTITALRKALCSLPTSLDEIYSRMLDAIDPEHAQSVFKILSWLCFALHPPSLDELAEDLAVDLEKFEYDASRKLQDTNDILYMCGSLVARASGANSVIKLSHHTVKEYLTSKNILESSNRAFHVTEKTADECIAKTCLVYLNSRSYASREDARLATPRNPLASYATGLWSEHFRRCGQNAELLALARKLFLCKERSFLDWAWIVAIVPEGYYTEWPRYPKPSVLLCYAAFLSSPGLLEAMIGDGAPINDEGCMYGTALIISAYMADLQCLELLLAHGAEVNVQAGCLGNSLQAAAARGWVEGVEKLISHGADVNATGGQFGTSLNAAIYSPFAEAKSEDLVRKLLDAGAEVSSASVLQDEYPVHPSPLYLACKRGAISIAKLLLEKGADAQQAGCLQIALYGRYIDLAEMLLKRGAKFHLGDGSSLNSLGVNAGGGLTTLRFLIESWDADYQYVDTEGRTVLHLAARDGTTESLEYLLSLGMDINQTDAKGWSAIHYASDCSTPDNLRLLLQKSRSNISDLAVWSPLHLACKRNTLEALDLLLQAGFQPTTVTTTEPAWQWILYDIAISFRNHHLISADLKTLHPLLEHPDTGTMPPPMSLARARICDGCFPIITFNSPPRARALFGPIFHCTECEDFDYCFMCRVTAEQTHPHSHSWTIMSGSQDIPKPIYQGASIVKFPGS